MKHMQRLISLKRESRSDGGQAKTEHFRHVAFSGYAMNIYHREENLSFSSTFGNSFHDTEGRISFKWIW